MKTTLNDLHMLPGQDEAFNTTDVFNLDNTSTTAGQPYNTAPWNYNCPGESPYGDATINASATPYASTVVDWVLVSIRENNTLATSENLERYWGCYMQMEVSSSVYLYMLRIGRYNRLLYCY